MRFPLRGWRIVFILLLLAFTLSLHYGLIPHTWWLHLIHRRLCYIPIILSSIWFGLPGGVITSAVLSLAVLPLAVSQDAPLVQNEELVEIIFYLGIGFLTGFLVQKSERARWLKEQAERELARSERLALAGQTAAGIAHEVRTPLGAILGAAEILDEDYPAGHPRRRFLDILRKESRKLSQVVEDFLDLSRPVSIAPAQVEPSSLIADCLAAVQPAAGARHIEVQTRLEVRSQAWLDRTRMEQAVVNLLLNAIQLSPEGGTVQVETREQPDGSLAIHVDDAGPGLPPGDEERIFEPFYSKRTGGTGLGLSLARQIVAAHGGTLSARNSPAGGAVFTIQLPPPARSG